MSKIEKEIEEVLLCAKRGHLDMADINALIQAVREEEWGLIERVLEVGKSLNRATDEAWCVLDANIDFECGVSHDTAREAVLSAAKELGVDTSIDTYTRYKK